MSPAADVSETIRARVFPFPKKHFVTVADLDPPDVTALLDLADGFVELNRQTSK
jgi:aspartate carbamoyltransferase catalytic subunit